jgi:hypothetical protein
VGSFLVGIDVTVQIPDEDLANDFLFLLISPRGRQHNIQHVGEAYHQKSSTSPFNKWHLHSLSQKA